MLSCALTLSLSRSFALSLFRSLARRKLSTCPCLGACRKSRPRADSPSPDAVSEQACVIATGQRRAGATGISPAAAPESAQAFCAPDTHLPAQHVNCSRQKFTHHCMQGCWSVCGKRMVSTRKFHSLPQFNSSSLTSSWWISDSSFIRPAEDMLHTRDRRAYRARPGRRRRFWYTPVYEDGPIRMGFKIEGEMDGKDLCGTRISFVRNCQI